MGRSSSLLELFLVRLHRLLERDTGAQPLERDGRLRSERLHHGHVVSAEDPPLVQRRDGDNGRHALLHEQRDERGALRADGGREPRADHARAFRVVDGERRRLEDRARDPRRLVLEVEAQSAPPVEILAAGPGEVAGRLAPVLRDEGQRDEADFEELRELVEQRACDALDVRAARELAGDAADALELPRRVVSSALPRAAAAKNRTQERRCGRGAAERANRRETWGRHWALGLYGAIRAAARNRLQKWKSPPLGGSVRRALPIAPRMTSADAAVRIAQCEGG
jgi:hypothetical protein